MKRITVDLDEGLFEQLRRAAFERREPMAEIVRDALGKLLPPSHMTAEATASVVLPGNKTGSVPDLTVTDEDGQRQTLWDFTAWAPEFQTLKGAEQLLRTFGWRPAHDGSGTEWTWRESNGCHVLNVEAV